MSKKEKIRIDLIAEGKKSKASKIVDAIKTVLISITVLVFMILLLFELENLLGAIIWVVGIIFAGTMLLEEIIEMLNIGIMYSAPPIRFTSYEEWLLT